MAAARQAIAARTDVGELRAVIAYWMASLPASACRAPHDVANQAATSILEQQFEQRGLNSLIDAVRRLDQPEGVIPAGQWMLAILIGAAAADLIVDGFMQGEVREPRLFQLDVYGAWDSFKSELSSRLADNERAQEGFWSELVKLVDGVRTEPREVLRAHLVEVRRQIDDYLKSPTIEEAWETRLDSLVLFEHAYLFSTALSLDSERCLQLVGRFPHPVFAMQCVDCVSETLATLLHQAPPAFERSSDFIPEGMVVARVLSCCASEARRLAWGDSSAPRAVDVANRESLEPALASLQDFISGVLDALFARADAFELAWAWLERLIYEGEHRGVWHFERRSGSGILLDPLMILITRLAGRLAPRADPVAWIRAAEELRREDRLAAVVAVAVHGPGSELATLLMDTEPAGVSVHGAVQRQSAVIGKIFAQQFVASDEPARSVLEGWDALRPVRERAWRAQGGLGSGAGELFALGAICAVEIAEGDQKVVLWQAVRSLLEEAMKMDRASAPLQFWPQAVCRFCRFLPKVSTSGVGTTLDAVAELLRPFVAADEVYFEMVSALQEAGLEPELIDDATRRWGTTLPTLAEQFLASNALRIERRVFSSQLIDRVRHFATAGETCREAVPPDA